MKWWNNLMLWLFPLDPNPGIGWGEFKLSDDHPFYRAALVHDARYDELVAGTSSMTLAEIDSIFLGNCLRLATGFEDAGDRERYRREAWMCFATVKLWGKIARGTLADYKPKENNGPKS